MTKQNGLFKYIDEKEWNDVVDEYNKRECASITWSRRYSVFNIHDNYLTQVDAHRMDEVLIARKDQYIFDHIILCKFNLFLFVQSFTPDYLKELTEKAVEFDQMALTFDNDYIENVIYAERENVYEMDEEIIKDDDEVSEGLDVCVW